MQAPNFEFHTTLEATQTPPQLHVIAADFIRNYTNKIGLNLEAQPLNFLDATGSGGYLALVLKEQGLNLKNAEVYTEETSALDYIAENLTSNNIKGTATAELPHAENMFDLIGYNYKAFPDVEKLKAIIKSLKPKGVLIVYGYMLPHEHLLKTHILSSGFEALIEESIYANEWLYSFFQKGLKSE